MKKILYYIAISVICALPFNSCTLDEETSTDVEKKNFMRDAKEAEIVLQGVYRSTIEDGQYGYHLSILFNLGTDMEQAEGNSTENYRIIPGQCISYHSIGSTNYLVIFVCRCL